MVGAPQESVRFLQKLLNRIGRGEIPSRSDIRRAVEILISGGLAERNRFTLGAFLGLMTHRELLTVELLRGLYDAIAAICPDQPLARDAGAVVAVGSGKDDFKTFNVTTCAAFTAASCGAHVIKVGCGAESSVAGSSDVLADLGVLPKPPGHADDILATLGICVADASTAVSSIFEHYVGQSVFFNALELVLPSFVGIRAPHLVYGVADSRIELVAELLRGQVHCATILAGRSGAGEWFDEASIFGPTLMAMLQGSEITTRELHPGDFGLPVFRDDQVVPPSSRQEAMATVRDVLRGEASAAHLSLVAANSAVILKCTGVVDDLVGGTTFALDSLRAGRPWQLLQRLREFEGDRR